MTFDPREYWRTHGRDIYQTATSGDQVRAEARLREVLAGLPKPASIAEIGPGKGRITAILRDLWPKAAYTAVEIGPDQAAVIAERWPDIDLTVAPVQDWRPTGVYDLVLTSEVLMHIPPAELRAVIDKLLTVARRHLLLIEWMPLSWELAAPTDEFNWPHDYLSYLGDAHVWRTDRQGIFLVEKVA